MTGRKAAAAIGALAAALALVGSLGHPPPAGAAVPAVASGTDQPAGKKCVAAEEARVRAAGDSGEGAALKFTSAFYARTFAIDVSLDGMDGRELPISIEEVCEVPKRLRKQAAQLAGGDGVALVLPKTTIWEGGTLQQGPAALTALDGADTATLRARLTRPKGWSEDEDGNKIPTFRTGRIDITD